MVAAVVNNTGFLIYRVQWKIKGFSVNTRTYEVGSIDQLARILWRAEGISQQSIEHIYVHQIDPKTGAAFELIAVEPDPSKTRLNPHLLWDDEDGDDPGLPTVLDLSRIPPPVQPRQVTSNFSVKPRFRAVHEPDDPLVIEGIFYGARKAPAVSVIETQTSGGVEL